MLVKCLFCSKPFKTKLNRIERGRGKYCSRRCKNDSQKGKKQTKESNKKRRETAKLKGIRPPVLFGKDHPNWREKKKGKIKGYQAVHIWLSRHYGKANHCSFDKEHHRFFEWANISSVYMRDIDDWTQLCAKCHRQYDMIRRGEVYG